MATFGEWLKEAREEAGITQDVLAEKAGFKKAYVSKFEKDSAGLIPPLETILAFANALGVGIEEPLRAMGYLESEIKTAKTNPSKFNQDIFARLSFKHSKMTPGRRKEFGRILEMVERDYDRALLDKDQ